MTTNTELQGLPEFLRRVGARNTTTSLETLNRWADEVERIQAAEPVHKNHLPDLRYVLKVLQGAHVQEHQRGDVQAAITGMRYIIKRTEEAAAHPAPAQEQQVTEMRLCEVAHLAFKPDQLYRFTAAPGCKECTALSEGISTPAGQPTDLHDAIMNLPSDPVLASKDYSNIRIAYLAGHRDARHAAAEIATLAASQPAGAPRGALSREELRKKIMDAMHPLSEKHDYWRGWPGTWSFAEAALTVLDAHGIGTASTSDKEPNNG